jgi:hypothetical protein
LAEPQTAVYNAPSGGNAVGQVIGLLLLAGVVGVGVYAVEQFDLVNRIEVLLHGFPRNQQQAQRDLLLLSRDWFIGKLNNDPWVMSRASQEATRIRQQYPGAGPEGGYTLDQVFQAGLLTQDQYNRLKGMAG